MRFLGNSQLFISSTQELHENTTSKRLSVAHVCGVPIPNLFCLPRFVRREKEIAESRFEVAQGESLRYRLRVEHLERELKEVQDSLSATKERMQVCDFFYYYYYYLFIFSLLLN